MAKLTVKHFRYIDAGKKVMHALLPEVVVRSILFRVIRSWLFQGVLYMEYSEIVFRVAVESMLVAVLLQVVSEQFTFINFALSIVLAHTVMWLFNGHFWALSLGGNRRMAKNRPDNILSYFSGLNQRLLNNSSIDGCVVFGSLARGEFTVNSDIDILLCKKKGLCNIITAYLIGMRERFIAFLHRIPIEMYFYDINVFERIDEGERPMLIKDDSGSIQEIVENVIEYSAYPLDQQEFFRKNQH